MQNNLDLSKVKPDVNMFKDLYEWCNEGILYLRCLNDEKSFLKGSEHYVNGVIQETDDETGKLDIIFWVEDKKWDSDIYISYRNPNFELVLK